METRTESSRNNKRGRRSREEILDAAARVMAARGYAGTSVAVISAESGLPKSAIYHHFHSKGGLLSAVMARGLDDFFEAMRTSQANPPAGGTHRDRLRWFLDRTAEVFASRADFLRLHILLLLSEEADEAEVAEILGRVRADGRVRMNQMIRTSFADEGEEIAAQVADRLDYFGVAGFDGAFIAANAEASHTVAGQMEQLGDAIAALGEAIVASLRTP